MTQRAVEVVVGRLATDEGLRESFRRAPARTLGELASLGLELSPVEIAALRALDAEAVEGFARALDARLQKAVLVSPAAGAGEEEDEA